MFQHNPYLPARIAETHVRELRTAAAEYRDAQAGRRGRSHHGGRLRRLGRSMLSVVESIVTP